MVENHLGTVGGMIRAEYCAPFLALSCRQEDFTEGGESGYRATRSDMPGSQASEATFFRSPFGEMR